MLERSVVEKCCTEVLERSVVEKCCSEVLEKILEKRVVEKCRRVRKFWRRELYRDVW